jgi:hypothetical protein
VGSNPIVPPKTYPLPYDRVLVLFVRANVHLCVGLLQDVDRGSWSSFRLTVIRGSQDAGRNSVGDNLEGSVVCGAGAESSRARDAVAGGWPRTEGGKERLWCTQFEVAVTLHYRRSS